MNRIAFLLLAASLSCRTVDVAPTPTIQDTQRRIATHAYAWMDDTIPLVAFHQPFVYGFWRLQVAACLGRDRDGWPKMYLAPITPLGPDFSVARTYIRGEGYMVFGLGSETEAWIVRHEYLHWIAAPEDTHDHPAKYFGPESRCGSLVNPAKGN